MSAGQTVSLGAAVALLFERRRSTGQGYPSLAAETRLGEETLKRIVSTMDRGDSPVVVGETARKLRTWATQKSRVAPPDCPPPCDPEARDEIAHRLALYRAGELSWQRPREEERDIIVSRTNPRPTRPPVRELRGSGRTALPYIPPRRRRAGAAPGFLGEQPPE